MFRCKKCRETFDGKMDNPYSVDRCPRCDSECIEEVCINCGRVWSYPGVDFYGNYCRECLMQKLTYKTGHDFLRDAGYLVDFVFDRLFGAFVPDGVNPEQKAKTEELASKLFERRVCNDLICDETTVMENLIGYIFDDDPLFAESFAEWVQKQEGVVV